MEKLFQLEGKVVLITGSMSGIGLATAKLFLKLKLKGIILLDINEDASILEKLKGINNSTEVLYRKCDVGDAQDMKEAYNYAWNSFGYIHLAVHCAGICHEDDSHKIVCINVGGVIDGSMWLWNKMRKDTGGEGGTIINISSTVGLVNTYILPIYAATKQAVRSFSECIGNTFHYERTGVRVLTVCPGGTNTAIITNTRCIYGTLNEELKKLQSSLTFQQAESVAKVILETYEKATSGTVWVSHRDLPAIQHECRDEQELIEAYFTK